MAALLVALAIMAVMMTVVMPVWRQTAQREKEEELVFRGKQYVHAIGLFQKKYANSFPPNFDVLVEQRFLRKKFKDPITNDDFVPIPAGATAGTAQQNGARGATGSTGSTGGASTAGRQTTPGPGSTQPGGGRGGGPTASSPGQTAAGISGVTSKSKDQSIRLYNGRGHYNEWAFIYIQQQQTAGAGAAGTSAPGQRGNQPGQPPGPGGIPGIPGQRGRGPNGPNGPGRGNGTNGPGRSTSPFGASPFSVPPPRGRL